jgi:hypothetical protein
MWPSPEWRRLLLGAVIHCPRKGRHCDLPIGIAFKLAGRALALAARKSYITFGNNGRNDALVYHLARSASQEDGILVERINLSVQSDAIYEVNGDGHLIVLQRIQEWILQ